jgi:hypothetical protein
MYCLSVVPLLLWYLMNANKSDQQLICYVKTHTDEPQ